MGNPRASDVHNRQLNKMREDMQKQQKMLVDQLASLKQEANNVRREKHDAHSDFIKLKSAIQSNKSIDELSRQHRQNTEN